MLCGIISMVQYSTIISLFFLQMAESLKPEYIAIIAAGSSILLILIVLLVLWKLHIIPRTKTHGM